MSRPTRVLFWTTTLQADVVSLARHLAGRADFETLVVADDAATWAAEAVERLLPLRAPLCDRRARGLWGRLREFDADVTVVDNHFPPRPLSPALFVLWHGFGWKGPNDRAEFAPVHAAIRRLTGGPTEVPNPRFLWRCYGPTDLEHRHAVSGFARENLASLGSAQSDDLVGGKVTRDAARAHYPPAFRAGRLALLAFTWHYGRAFAHLGDDVELLERLLDHLARHDCRALLRLHDRRRHERGYLRALERLAERRPDALRLEFKDQHRDTLLALLAADLMVSNFSSILNDFYVTGRPALHLYPVRDADEAFLWRTWSWGRVRSRKVASARFVWKLSPEENGGLLVHDFAGLEAAIDRALAEPTLTAAASRRFLETHLAPVDGRRCQAMAEALAALAHRAREG